MHKTVVLLLALTCALAATVQPGGARTADAKGWCAAVIKVNTKYGTMKNTRFLPPGQVPLSAWKKVIDATLAGHDRYLALAPSEIKTAVKHQIAWFAKVPMTVAEVNKITRFERMRCGITFGA